MANSRENNISFEGSVLHYRQSGHGPEALLIFHGFGQDNHVFETLTEKLNDRFTFYVFDLFFHGKSFWAKNENPLEKQVLKAFVKQFIEYENINRFSVLGFSMGAKFALTTAESFPERINQIFLLAPEGIKISLWYTLATFPLIFRKLFKGMIHHPNRFLLITRILKGLKLADKGLIRFAENQMNSLQKRKKVYYSWVVFRHLKFNPRKLARTLNQYDIMVTFIAGKHDHVIPVKSINSFLERLKKHSTIILETGHNGLIQQSVDVIDGIDLIQKKQ